MHEGGDILNELQLSVLLMRPYFIVRFYSWRVVGSMLGAGGLVKVFPRVAVHVRQRAFIHDCFRHFSFFPNFFFYLDDPFVHCLSPLYREVGREEGGLKRVHCRVFSRLERLCTFAHGCRIL